MALVIIYMLTIFIFILKIKFIGVTWINTIR